VQSVREQTTRKAASARCKQPMGTEATAVMQQSADKGQTAHGSDLHLPACMARKWDTTKAVKDKMSAVVKKALRSILACIPETALLTFCTGTLGYFHPVYLLMLPNCVGSTDARTWRLADGPRRRCDSPEGSRVGRPRWARTGAVMSNPLPSRSSTPILPR
jgi:hypothetical protein